MLKYLPRNLLLRRYTHLQDDRRHHFIAANLIRHRCHCNLRNHRVFGKDCLNFQRRYVFATAPDYILTPVDKVQLPVIALAHHIACMQVIARPGLRSSFRVFQVFDKETASRVITHGPHQ